MAEIIKRWRADALPGGFEPAFRELTGGYVADISDTARTKYRSEYERKIDGKTFLLGPHLKFGQGTAEYCARIYWWVDREQRRFVIGHIGVHLRDDSW